MYRWISSKGEIVKTKTVKEFAERFKFPPSMARSLAAGVRSRLRGWCSGSSKPRVKKARNRFLTKLVNTRTGESAILGASITGFARQHDLCDNEVWKLVNGRKIAYRGWMLQKSFDLANEYLAESGK